MDSAKTDFKGDLAHHLCFGHALEIVVKSTDNAKWLDISLLSHDPKYNDIGLHIRIYFNIDKICLRSCHYNDTKEINKQFPTSKLLGNFFQIYLVAGDDKFHISINEKSFTTYDYNMPLNELQSIEICGDVQHVRQVDHRQLYPSPWPTSTFKEPYPYYLEFSNDIPIKFQPGHLIVMTARAYGRRTGDFFINFKHSHNETQELHFNVRYFNQLVVRNHLKHRPDIGKYFSFVYGAEEYTGGFPFKFNKTFKLGILFQKDAFAFAVDGRYFCSFNYKCENVLENIIGMKVFSRSGTRIKVTEIEHIQLEDPNFTKFEKFTKVGFFC